MTERHPERSRGICTFHRSPDDRRWLKRSSRPPHQPFRIMARLSSMFRGLIVVTLLVLTTAGITFARQAQQPRVLVFSKTAGFRHSSIETGVALVKKIGAERGFAVDATEDASAFTDANLKKYRA